MTTPSSKVEGAVEFIVKRLQASGSKLDDALAIGQFLLDTLFGGNPLAFTSKSSDSPSFRGVCGDKRLQDFGLRRRTLADYVRVHVLTLRLPAGTESLGLAQRIKLLPAEPADQVRLAVQAVQEGWSAREVEAAVRDAARVKAGKARTQQSLTPAVEATFNVKFSSDRLKATELAGVQTSDFPWIYTHLQDGLGILEDYVATVEAEWQARGETGPLDLAAGASAVKNAEELDDLLEDLTGQRPEPLVDPPAQVLRRLTRAGSRLAFDLRSGSPDVRAWWQRFRSDMDQLAGASGPMPSPSAVAGPAGKKPRRSRASLVAHDDAEADAPKEPNSLPEPDENPASQPEPEAPEPGKVTLDKEELRRALADQRGAIGNGKDYFRDGAGHGYNRPDPASACVALRQAPNGNGVEAHTYKGRRYSAVPLKGTAAPGEVVLVPAKGLQSVLTPGSGRVTVRVARNHVHVEAGGVEAALPRELQAFHFWDEMWKDTRSVSRVTAERLIAALGYASKFVSEEEKKKPRLCATEARDGALFATTGTSVAIITAPWLDGVTMRVHGDDVGAIQTFLRPMKKGEVEILEHERAAMFRRADGGYIGVTKSWAAFPVLGGGPRDASSWWSVPRSDLGSVLTRLGKTAKSPDAHLKVNDGVMTVGVDGGTGDVPGVQVGGDASVTGRTITVSWKHLAAACALASDGNVRLGLVAKPLSGRPDGGYITIEEVRHDDTYRTLLAWLCDVQSART